ncbi:glutamine synthetase family protein [Microbaculum marinisediminis]|uniref:Glutamine synthetase family protein n=1 Tax=Microbaculum marinisediminis TaxID=2931392 RepID=A0AAW5QTI3_9HYPH|nr:glutamine synthetase family protein [Microbaculum sp. A6E488]MCT8971406.1 glutamine synthetase family protein [Microbaculum sp. A6E488]
MTEQAIPLNKIALDGMVSGEIDLVQMEVPDLNGTLRGKFVSAKKVAAGGKSAVCTVLYQLTPADDVWESEHSSYDNGFPDALGVPDMSTAIRLPWRDGMAAVLYDVVYPNGTQFPLSPRSVLRRVAERFEETGYTPMFGMEFEAFIFHADRGVLAENRHHELTSLGRMHNAYRLTQAEEARELGAEFIRRMRSIGITVEVFHTELGYGAVEFALAPAPAMQAADNAARAKTYFRELCAERGLVPSFMAKWKTDESGCGGHVHQSVWKDGENAFYDPKAGDDLSLVGRQYLAGLLAGLSDCGVLFRPTVNSFRRFSVQAWAPENVSWGYDNRSAALRVITYPTPNACRIEHRVPGADVNPWLAVAAMLAGGHLGIDRTLVPQRAAQGNAVKAGNFPRLADNLGDATEVFAASEFCRDYFGAEFVDQYAASRRVELQHWNDWLASEVTSFELRRYFETS